MKETFHFPRWDELPDLLLYMDQVLLVLNRTLEPLIAESVTATMLNNYVKQRLTAPAEKKKYDRTHVAQFFVICLLKQVLSMTEISALQSYLLESGTLPEVFDRFACELERQLGIIEAEKDSEPVLVAAICALVSKLQVERMLAAKEVK